jgi:hypothetical protein
MRDSSRVRSYIVWAAAYVIALQATLLPLSVAAAAPLAAIVCTSGSHADASLPLNPAGCPCAGGCGMQCHTQTLAMPPSIAVAATRTRAGTMAPELLVGGFVQRFIRCPQIPRAPPVA